MSFGLLAGCATAAPVTSSPDASPGGLLVDTGTPSGGACASGATSFDCPCDGGTGTQTCVNGNWGACDCSMPIPIVTYDAGPIAEEGMRCKGGYYTGTFEGTYWSGAFDLGFGSLFPVPIKALGDGTTPGLAITLEKQTQSLGEFGTTYTVSGGCVVGNADALGTENPFVGSLTGNLDCKTGKFTGTLDGYYNLLKTGIIYKFNGPVEAQFTGDGQSTAQLSGGKWNVKEKQSMATNGPGGSGTWSAIWTSDNSPPLPSQCQAFLNGDAGTATTPTGDAGTTP